MRTVSIGRGWRLRGCLLAVVVAVMVVLQPGPARAEVNFALRDVGRGVTLPVPNGIAGDFDVTSVHSNPAGLATLGGFSLGFGATDLAEQRTVRGGGGWGAFIAFPLALRLRAGEPFRLTYGFSWERFQAPASWRADAADLRDNPYGATLFFNSVGVGTRKASFGWTITRITWTDSPESQGTTTHHVGISLRPARFVALGGTWRDVFEPTGRSGTERFGRSIDVEAAVRPLGDWRLEVAAGAMLGADEFLDLRGRVVLRPLAGLTVFGNLESVQRRFGAAGRPGLARLPGDGGGGLRSALRAPAGDGGRGLRHLDLAPRARATPTPARRCSRTRPTRRSRRSSSWPVSNGWKSRASRASARTWAPSCGWVSWSGRARCAGWCWSWGTATWAGAAPRSCARWWRRCASGASW